MAGRADQGYQGGRNTAGTAYSPTTAYLLQAGIKCKAAQLQDWLDIHCITFRTESSRNRNKADKEPAKKKSTKQKEPEEVLTEAAPARGKSRRGRKKN